MHSFCRGQGNAHPVGPHSRRARHGDVFPAGFVAALRTSFPAGGSKGAPEQHGSFWQCADSPGKGAAEISSTA